MLASPLLVCGNGGATTSGTKPPSGRSASHELSGGGNGFLSVWAERQRGGAGVGADARTWLSGGYIRTRLVLCLDNDYGGTVLWSFAAASLNEQLLTPKAHVLLPLLLLLTSVVIQDGPSHDRSTVSIHHASNKLPNQSHCRQCSHTVLWIQINSKRNRQVP